MTTIIEPMFDLGAFSYTGIDQFGVIEAIWFDISAQTFVYQIAVAGGGTAIFTEEIMAR